MTAWDQKKALEWDLLAEWYDLLWPRTDDHNFYVDLARQSNGPVLEVGCGTGRVACHHPRHGVRVLGIDISPGQLRVALQRKHQLPAGGTELVDFRQASAAEFRDPGHFSLVIACFSTMFEVGGPSARAAIYSRCYENLRPGGLLAIDNSFHDFGENASWGKPRPARAVELFGSFPHPVKPDATVWHFESQDYGPEGLMELTIWLDEATHGGPVSRRSFSVTRHYATQEQTLSELREAGFREVDLYGGFFKQPFLDPALRGNGRQVFIASK